MNIISEIVSGIANIILRNIKIVSYLENYQTYKRLYNGLAFKLDENPSPLNGGKKGEPKEEEETVFESCRVFIFLFLFFSNFLGR